MNTKSHRTPIKQKTPNSLRTKRFYERIASARADKIDRNRQLSMAALELQMMREDNTISLEEAIFLEQELEKERYSMENDIIEQEEEWIQAVVQDYDLGEMAQEPCISCPNGKLGPFLDQWKCTHCGILMSNITILYIQQEQSLHSQHCPGQLTFLNGILLCTHCDFERSLS